MTGQAARDGSKGMSGKDTDPVEVFRAENRARIAAYGTDREWRDESQRWTEMAFERRYMYHFEWLGRPVIQLPGDIVAVQETIWRDKPDLIIETGIAHGGSLALSASILAMLEIEEAAAAGTVVDPRAPKHKVIGIDIDIRAHNRTALEAHTFSAWMHLIEGSSLDAAVVDQARQAARGARKVMVILDSNHTHDHVLQELELYAPLVSSGAACFVFDTAVERLPAEFWENRPWGPGDNPKTAVDAFLAILENEGRTALDGAPLRLQLDTETDAKLMLTASDGGWLRRI
jgi:cephalosporin hydroxylase